MRPKTLLKVTTNTTTHGSKQQKTAEDGLYLKTITQWLQKKDLKIMWDTEEILKADQQDTSTEWDWVMMKWPTSHITKAKKQIKSQKMKQFGKQLQQLRTPHPACRRVAGTSKCSRKDMIQNILMDWWSRTSWWIDREKTTWGKNSSEKQIRLGTTQTRPRWNRKIRVTDPDSREMKIA